MFRLKTGAGVVCLLFAACSGSPATSPPGGGSGGSSGTGGSTPGSGGAPATGGASASGGSAPIDAPAADLGVAPGSGGAPVDVAGSDAPVEVAPATCAPGALLCEDFESYAVGGSLAPNWMTDTTGGTVMVDSTKPHAGTKAVHFTATSGVANLLQIWKQGAPLFPIKGNSFYGRVMMWLTKQPTGGVHFNTVQANGLLPGTTQVAKYAYGAMYEKLMAGYTVRPNETALPTVDCGKSPAGAPGYPVGRWVCAEWKFDGANDEMHYWFDGVAQTSVDVVKTDPSCGATPPPGNRWQAPIFNKLMLGWYSQVFPMPVELWMDDIVISTERIGCPK